MSTVETSHAVLTLDEVAAYLRVPATAVEELARAGTIPSRKIGESWRFFRPAIEGWLSQPDAPDTSREILMRQFGCFAGDESLEQIRKDAYARRGRPETEAELITQ